MKTLNIPYTTWKQVVASNNLTLYHIPRSTASNTVWCGVREFLYTAEVDADDFDEWTTTFSGSSTLVINEDDAIAHIIGILNPSTAPMEPDGRVNIVNAPMTQGMYSWWTGSGDILPSEVPPQLGPISGRGLGDNLDLIFTTGSGEEHTKVASFTSYVEIYDGEGAWEPVVNWSVEDRFSIYFLMPPNYTACTAASGTGNANIYPTGMGFSMVIPAAGDGAYDIDLDKAAPLQVGEGNPMAFWSMTDIIDGTISPSVGEVGQPTGNVALLYDMGWRVYACKNMPMASPRGIFAVDSDKSEPIHKNWKIALHCVKNSPGPGNLGIWLKFFRPDTSEPDYPPTV